MFFQVVPCAKHPFSQGDGLHKIKREKKSSGLYYLGNYQAQISSSSYCEGKVGRGCNYFSSIE
jgi:hypothetical protein